MFRSRTLGWDGWPGQGPMRRSYSSALTIHSSTMNTSSTGQSNATVKRESNRGKRTGRICLYIFGSYSSMFHQLASELIIFFDDRLCFFASTYKGGLLLFFVMIHINVRIKNYAIIYFCLYYSLHPTI